MDIATYFEQISEILGYIGQQGALENYRSYCNYVWFGLGFVVVLTVILQIISKLRRVNEYIDDGVALLIESDQNKAASDEIRNLLLNLYNVTYTYKKEKFFFSFEILRSLERNYFILFLPRKIYSLLVDSTDNKIKYRNITNQREKFIESLDKDVITFNLELFYDFVIPVKYAVKRELVGKMNKDDWFYMQMLCRPKGDKWKRTLERYLKSLEKGEDTLKQQGCIFSFTRTILPFLKMFAWIFSSMTHDSSSSKEVSDGKQGDVKKDEERIRMVNEKMAGIGFETSMRTLVSGSDMSKSYDQAESIVSALSQEQTDLNYLTASKFQDNLKENRKNDLLLAYMNRNVVDIMNADEILRMLDLFF